MICVNSPLFMVNFVWVKLKSHCPYCYYPNCLHQMELDSCKQILVQCLPWDHRSCMPWYRAVFSWSKDTGQCMAHSCTQARLVVQGQLGSESWLLVTKFCCCCLDHSHMMLGQEALDLVHVHGAKRRADMRHVRHATWTHPLLVEASLMKHVYLWSTLLANHWAICILKLHTWHQWSIELNQFVALKWYW